MDRRNRRRRLRAEVRRCEFCGHPAALRTRVRLEAGGRVMHGCARCARRRLRGPVAVAVSQVAA